jgi:hypothetical protein
MDYNCRPGRWNAPPIYVEPMSFVQRCMREGIVRHRLPLKQGMGGVVGRYDFYVHCVFRESEYQ